MKRLLLISCVVLFYSTAHGDILKNFGMHSNINRPEVWQDQLSNYATGGSIHTRNPSNRTQLFSIDMPSFDAGCGGINVFFGGFSYINSDQLEKLIKNIGSSALSFGVMLTIQSLSPSISNLLEYLESVTRSVNGLNINSCQVGASIAAGFFPKNEQSQRLACQARKMDGGLGATVSDAFTARYECNDGAKMQETNKTQGHGLLAGEYNLVWDALTKDLPDMPTADKELLMSLSGTIIARNQGASGVLEHFKSLTGESDILNNIVFGNAEGVINLYKCQNEISCLGMRIVKTPFTYDESMVAKISKIMRGLEEKIVAENAGNQQMLSPAEKDLISKTSIPILKMLLVQAGLRGGQGLTHSISDYLEAVAFDYVVGYLDSLLDIVYNSLSKVAYSQIDDSVNTFKKEISYLKKSLFNERIKAFDRLNTLVKSKVRIEQVQNMLFQSFASYRN